MERGCLCLTAIHLLRPSNPAPGRPTLSFSPQVAFCCRISPSSRSPAHLSSPSVKEIQQTLCCCFIGPGSEGLRNQAVLCEICPSWWGGGGGGSGGPLCGIEGDGDRPLSQGEVYVLAKVKNSRGWGSAVPSPHCSRALQNDLVGGVVRAGRVSRDVADEDVGPEEGRGCSQVTSSAQLMTKEPGRSHFPTQPKSTPPSSGPIGGTFPGGNKEPGPPVLSRYILHPGNHLSVLENRLWGTTQPPGRSKNSWRAAHSHCRELPLLTQLRKLRPKGGDTTNARRVA